MRNLDADLRTAWRTLRRDPWSSAALVLTLALGIAATTAVHAVFNYAVFRPVPGIGDPSGLVSVYVDHGTEWRSSMTHAHLKAVRETPAFDGLAGYGFGGVPGRLAPDGPAEVLPVIDVSLATLALLALGLAITGTYAVVSRRVQEHRREFGIRLALGASEAAIVTPILRRASAMGVAGVILGLGLYAAVAGLIEHRLYGLSALDRLSLLTAVSALLVSSVIAAYLPARRAARVPPAAVLTQE